MRQLISKPRNRITQGTIFSGVYKSYVCEVECFGLSITARCDTARDFKAPLLNFLPVIRMEDWMSHEALPRCREKVHRSSLLSLKKYLIDKDGSSVILDSFGPARAFARPECTDRIFLTAKAGYEAAKRAENLFMDQRDLLPKSICKEVLTAAREVVAHKHQDYFFLECIDATAQDTEHSLGYVVLLREVRSIPRAAALKIRSGIDTDTITDRDVAGSTSEFNLRFHELAYPVSELNSPYMEQLMQAFSSLFARVGVPDIDKNFITRIDKFIGTEK